MSSMTTLLRLAAAQAARSHKAHMSRLVQAEREQRNAVRLAEKRRRELARNLLAASREEKQRYIESRKTEVAELNREVALILKDLSATLANTLQIDDTIRFDDLKRNEDPPPLPAHPHLMPVRPPDRDSFLYRVVPPTKFKSFLPGVKRRYEEQLNFAEEQYRAAVEVWKSEEKVRANNLERHRSEHKSHTENFIADQKAHNSQVDQLKLDYMSGKVEVVEEYCQMVLEGSTYPDSFPQLFVLSYVPSSRQLVVEMMLPDVGVIPPVAEYSYVQKNDEVKERLRKPAETKTLYQDLIASIALRTIHELFESDQGNHIDVVCFNGNVEAINRMTGKTERKCLISVRTTKTEFTAIDLRYVNRILCLRNLGAQVSRDPHEAVAVKPIVEYNMVDRRFVGQEDVLADLEESFNLMELDPFEFEHLVANLFGKMGLETKLTQSSRDGGVDCIAFDTRPVVGGKIVIQAKRYKNTVGVSAVRDLYGTMLNEGASKGLLVCTSGYGMDAYAFAKDKPIELIDGGGLLYMLKDVGIRARIVFPDE